MQFRLSVEAACRRVASISGIGRQRGFVPSESAGGPRVVRIGGPVCRAAGISADGVEYVRALKFDAPCDRPAFADAGYEGGGIGSAGSGQ